MSHPDNFAHRVKLRQSRRGSTGQFNVGDDTPAVGYALIRSAILRLALFFVTFSIVTHRTNVRRNSLVQANLIGAANRDSVRC